MILYALDLRLQKIVDTPRRVKEFVPPRGQGFGFPGIVRGATVAFTSSRRRTSLGGNASLAGEGIMK